MPVQLVRQPDAESLARHAARDLAISIQDAREARGVAHVCLAGGSTPLRCYELLDSQLDDWSGVHLWYGDERCVPFDDPESNHGQVKERLRARGAVWHPMPATLGPCRGRDRVRPRARRRRSWTSPISGWAPTATPPRSFPTIRCSARTASRPAITDSPKPPPQRITLTLPKLNESRRIVLMVTGEGKSEALARVMAGPDRTYPASLLDRTKLLVMADNAALPASEPMASDVWLIRHAETEWSKAGRHTGLTDIPLTEEGRAHAATLAASGSAVRRSPPSSSARCSARGRPRSSPASATRRRCATTSSSTTTATTRASPPTRSARGARAGTCGATGSPAASSADDVGARADRVIAEALAVDGDVALVAHGHVLRVVGARWIEQPASFARTARAQNRRVVPSRRGARGSRDPRLEPLSAAVKPRVDVRMRAIVRTWTLCRAHAPRPCQEAQAGQEEAQDRRQAHLQNRHQEGARQEEAGEGLQAGQKEEEGGAQARAQPLRLQAHRAGLPTVDADRPGRRPLPEPAGRPAGHVDPAAPGPDDRPPGRAPAVARGLRPQARRRGARRRDGPRRRGRRADPPGRRADARRPRAARRRGRRRSRPTTSRATTTSGGWTAWSAATSRSSSGWR